MATSMEDITSLRLYKACIAEFFGTMILVLIGCGSCINVPGASSDVAVAVADGCNQGYTVRIALAFGLAVATSVWIVAQASGGHINPAVTAAMLATRRISIVKAVFYLIFQLLGGMTGAGVLYGLIPEAHRGGLGGTAVNPNLVVGQAIGVELLITFILVLTVFAACDGKRRDLKGSAPLAIGLSVAMCHLVAVPLTGASMNTARSFGPAVVTGKWDDHWVYWVGPILGGALAGIVYEHLIAANASLAKTKGFLLSSDYDDDKFKAAAVKVCIIEEPEPAAEEEEEEKEKINGGDVEAAQSS